jgi:hypothetical protein
MTEWEFEWELDQELVDALVADRLDASGQAVLAEQVARMLPVHWVAPGPVVASLSRLVDKLGSERELFGWLERHPGRPRLVARLYVVIGMLDQISDDPAVLTALRELRRRVPFPPGLSGYLVPDTDDGTLAELSARIEAILAGGPAPTEGPGASGISAGGPAPTEGPGASEISADDRLDEAFRVSVAALAMLQEVAPRVGELDRDLHALGGIAGHVRQELLAAHAGNGDPPHVER